MPVTERVMATGSWSVRLRPDTPKDIRDLLALETAGFGHIIITPAQAFDSSISAAGLLAVARYTGVYRSRPSEYEMGGAGLVIWLGDEDGKGDVLEASGAVFNAASFTTAVGDLRPSSLDAGSVEALAGTYTNVFSWVSRRTALEAVMDFFTAEYRVNADGTLDAGAQATLYPTTTSPTAVVQRRSGGDDINISGVRATKMDTAKDLEDYTTRVALLANGVSGTANISPATTYRDLNGNLVEWARVIEGTSVGAGNETAAAQAQLNRFTSLRRAVTLSSDIYDIGAEVAAGDTIYVWDPNLDLVDTGNQISYRGETVFPLRMRVHGHTWPIRRGMGVYFRAPDSGGTVTDLTDWVSWETGDTTIDVGASPRPSASSTLFVPELSLGSWLSYTPVVGQPSAVTATNTRSRYIRNGHLVTGQFLLTVTGTGTAGNNITITLPVAAAVASGVVVGSAFIFDNSASARHTSTLELVFADTVVLDNPTGAGGVGGTPSFALANNDVIAGYFMYEAAA